MVYVLIDEKVKEFVEGFRSYMVEFEKEGKIREGFVGGGVVFLMDFIDRINDIFWYRIILVVLVLMFLLLILMFKGFLVVVLMMIIIFMGVMMSIWVLMWFFGKVFN